MKKLLLVTLATALMLPTYAAAQVEVGTRAFGIDIVANGGTITGVSIPGGGIFLGPTAYLMFFPSPNIMVGPEVNFNVLSGGGSTITTIGAAGWVGYLFTPAANSAYLAGNIALQFASVNGSSNTEFAAGGAVGYRAVVIQHVAVGVEGGYRRWFDLNINEIVISLKLGVVFP
jgi:hypothetical protein